MPRVFVNDAALHMLVAAGKSVLTSSTIARLEGRGGVGLDHEQALRNAIGLAESALAGQQSGDVGGDGFAEANPQAGGES